jgi:AraC-like DNA-binding protein
MSIITKHTVGGLSINRRAQKCDVNIAVEVTYFLDQKIEINCQFPFDGNAYYYQFIYTQEYLERFNTTLERPFSILHNTRYVHDSESDVCCKLKDVFYQLGSSKLTGGLQSVFFESQALMILLQTHLNCAEDADTTPCFNCKFLNIPSEKQKIMQARVLVMINLSDPPTIPALARMVHINECYLKKGFKEMFGTSVFDFVQQERIIKAKQLLRKNQYAIQDIALELGYSNASNFTNAFKKITSKSPSDWIKGNQVD